MDRLKILVWDQSGLCLITKRLESGAFTWSPIRDGSMSLSAAQLRLLFTGMDWTQLGGADQGVTAPQTRAADRETAKSAAATTG